VTLLVKSAIRTFFLGDEPDEQISEENIDRFSR